MIAGARNRGKATKGLYPKIKYYQYSNYIQVLFSVNFSIKKYHLKRKITQKRKETKNLESLHKEGTLE